MRSTSQQSTGRPRGRPFRWSPPAAAPSASVIGPDGMADTATIERMLDHRTCRRFTEQPVDDELLDLLLAATLSTPSKSDLQQCTVIVVDEEERRRAIADLIPSMPWIIESPRFLVFCGDSRRIRQVASRCRGRVRQ